MGYDSSSKACMVGMVEVKVTHSRSFIYGPILTLLLGNVKYDNVMDKFAIQNFRAKVKVIVTTF